MSYENAPATILLASRCAACARPLVDTASVETGMGPDCRRKYGLPDGLPDDTRQACNQAVYRLALQASDTASDGYDPADDLNLLINAAPRLADRIAERMGAVRIEENAGRLVVRAPYREEAVAAWRRVPGRQWDGRAKANSVPYASRAPLFGLLKQYYRGAVGIGPRGAFSL